MIVASFVFVCIFALAHTATGWLSVLDEKPRSRWLSAAGGIAVAYVFLHVLPELASHRATFADQLGTDEATAETIVYSLSLAGLVVFYGLEKAIKPSQPDNENAGRGDLPPVGTFWLHIGSFGAYNMIIGYLLLHREEQGLWSLVTYGVAMSVHFISNDFGLRQDHKHRYDSIARWLLAAAVIAGWVLGLVADLSELWIGFLFAFLAGGIVLNVMKEELPEERESRFWPFFGAAVAYAGLLLAI